MSNMFANIPEALSSSTDFLYHEVYLPHHDPLMYAHYAISNYKVLSMQSIKLTCKRKKHFHFHYFYLVPDSKSLTEECVSASYDCNTRISLARKKKNSARSTPPHNMHSHRQCAQFPCIPCKHLRQHKGTVHV